MADVHDTVDRLVEHGQEATDETVEAAYEEVGKSRRHSDKHDLSLGRLNLNAAVDLVPDHLRAAAIVYAHDRLDAAGVFDAVDRVVEDADYGRIEIRTKAIRESRTIGTTPGTGGWRRSGSRASAAACSVRRSPICGAT